MAQIMKSLQTKYVPVVPVDKKPTTPSKIFFDGDQLTEERARNAQYANILAETELERLNGLEPTFADWHLKKNIYEVIIKNPHQQGGSFLYVAQIRYNISFKRFYTTNKLSKTTMIVIFSPH